MTLDKKGCSGYSYKINICYDHPKNHLRIVQEDLNFFIDNEYMNIFDNLKVDYRASENDALALPRLVYENSKELFKCGCGSSFTF